MKVVEAIKNVLKNKKLSQTDLANRIGIDPHRMISRLRMKNISMKLASDMLRVLDYKIVIVPRETRLPDGCYEVES